MSFACACGTKGQIIDTRTPAGGDYTRRRYRCSACGDRWTTIERRAELQKGVHAEEARRREEDALAKRKLRELIGESL